MTSLLIISGISGTQCVKGYISTTGDSNSIDNLEQFPDPDEDSDSSYEDVGTSAINKAWDQSSLSDDHLILGSRQTSVDLSTLHPGPVQIFRLWQTYLDNVNPLLRVIHAPTLQGRIIEAASDLKTISPVFESLLFSIYSMAVLSLGMDECPLLLGSSKRELLTKYQFGCQQALLNCGFLRCGDRDCLTALYLYMVGLSMGLIDGYQRA